MNKKLYLIFLYILIVLLFPGCWSRIEPKNLSLTSSVLFDVKDNGEVQITKENMKLSGNSGGQGGDGGKSSTVQLNCEGRTPAEAVRDELNGRTSFGGYLSARFFTEKFAKTEMIPVMDFLLRDHLTDETSFMAVVKSENPQLIYSSTAGLSDSVGIYIDELSRTMPKKNSESVFVTTFDFIKDYCADDKQPVMGLVEIVKNESKPEGNAQSSSQGQDNTKKDYKLFYSGLAAFKNDKLVGYMDGIETRSYNFVTNKLKSAIISSSDRLTAAKVLSSKSKIKTDIEGSQVTISVDTKVGLSVIQEGSNIHVNEIGPLKSLEQEFNKQLETEIAASIRKAQQEFQSDIFGIGEFFHAQHPKEWKNMKKDWDDIFSKAKVTVTVKSSVVLSGETKNSFAEEEKTNEQ